MNSAKKEILNQATKPSRRTTKIYNVFIAEGTVSCLKKIAYINRELLSNRKQQARIFKHNANTR